MTFLGNICRVEYTFMANGKSLAKRAPRMAAVTPRQKSAEDQLLESFAELIDSAAGKMTDSEFKDAAKKSSATLDRAIVVHLRRRGRA